jgi:hypothetical protein
MLFDAIALIVLCGMMLVPLINIIVGLIVGAWLGGPVGALVGLALAVLISAVEKRLGDGLGWFEPESTAEYVHTHIAAPVALTRSNRLGPNARHAVLSAPAYFTELMPPLSSRMDSAADCPD